MLKCWALPILFSKSSHIDIKYYFITTNKKNALWRRSDFPHCQTPSCALHQGLRPVRRPLETTGTGRGLSSQSPTAGRLGPAPSTGESAKALVTAVLQIFWESGLANVPEGGFFCSFPAPSSVCHAPRGLQHSGYI